MKDPATLPDAIVRALAHLIDDEPSRLTESLDGLCAQWPDLAGAIRAEAEALVQARNAPPCDEEFATGRIGPFRILREIGIGGMGTVYLAEQDVPIRRRVALKVIRPGMDTSGVLARFATERQALALMDHDSIAKVYEAGTTPSGRPYFAMEYVQGIPITRYCDERRLSLDERLILFTQVCRGVQHAHVKGVIHRDLTPNNVLVSVIDGRPTVKIIDFGLARATERRLAEATLVTEQGAILGTPEYMSPEQAGLDALDIDTRSDVYTLGVMLYQLLTGRLPFESRDLRAVGYDAMCRFIREHDPPRPSTKITTVHGGPRAAADLRRTDPGALLRRLRGDLDWIVMKCLEKDRTRRYETVSELAADVQRHLDHDLVTARRPGLGYRLNKLVRRHRAQVVAVSAVLVTAITGAAVAVRYAIVATANEELANQRATANAVLAREKGALAEAEAAARDAAQQSATAAEQRADELEQVLMFQEAQWSEVDTAALGARLRRAVLAAARPTDRAALETGLTPVNFTDIALGALNDTLFAHAMAAIARGFDDKPLVKARLLQGVATTLRELGLLDHATAPQTEALAILRRMRGEDHADTLAAMTRMGYLLHRRGKLEEAKGILSETLANCRRVLVGDHPTTIAAGNHTGLVLRAMGRLDEAEPLVRDAVDRFRRNLGGDHRDTLSAIDGLGGLLLERGRLDESHALLTEALDRKRRVLGDEHSETLTSMGNMGNLLMTLGRIREAESLFREALAARLRVFGNEHPHTLSAMLNLGFALWKQGKFTEAEPHFRNALDSSRRSLGDDHPQTLISINNLGELLRSQGRLEEAGPLVREALERCQRVLGPEHPTTLAATTTMAMWLRALDRLQEAELFYREVLETRRRILREDDPQLLAALHNMCAVLQELGQLVESETLGRESLQRHRRVLGEDHPQTLAAMKQLAVVLLELDQLVEAEQCFRDALARLRRGGGDEHPHTLITIESLGRLLVRTGRHQEAVTLLASAEAATRRTFTQGNAHRLADLLIVLARAQIGLDPPVFAAAEASLTEAHAILAGARASSQRQHRACIAALAELYEAWHAVAPGTGRDGKAAEWRQRLETLR